MGKSLKNSVSPDEIYQAYGADTLRLYEMAMGPVDVGRPWQPHDIVGVYRFLQRLWRNVVNEETGETAAGGARPATWKHCARSRTGRSARSATASMSYGSTSPSPG